MNKKRYIIMCIVMILCALTISTKVKASQYTDDLKYISNTNTLARKIRDNAINRNKSFTVLAKVTFSKKVNTDVLNSYADSLVNKSMSEELSESSSDGDYLRYSWDEYKKSIKGHYSYSDSKYNYYIAITYDFKYYTTYSQEQKLDKDIEKFISSNINKNDTELKKVITIYSYISSNVKYNKNIGNLKYSAYSAYENKAAICQGYSTLLYKMLKEANFKDIRIIRSSSHSWNIVKIGNMYYHLDTTWEATSNQKGYYNYFLKGSSEIKKLNKHKMDSEYKTKKFKKEYPISNEDYMKVNFTKVKNKKNNKIRIKWEKNIYCDGYVIEYSKNKNFTNSKIIKIKNKATTHKTIKNLKKNKKYYIRIRSYKIIYGKKQYFSWSKAFLFFYKK